LLHVWGLWTAVDVGSVEEVDAGLQSLVHDLEAGRLIVTTPKFIVPKENLLT
jgi:hypothetical protein